MTSRPTRRNRKNYAMHRMILALGRAIDTTSNAEKDRASRWSAAWGLIAGIRGKGVRLRQNNLLAGDPRERRSTPR